MRFGEKLRRDDAIRLHDAGVMYEQAHKPKQEKEMRTYTRTKATKLKMTDHAKSVRKRKLIEALRRKPMTQTEVENMLGYAPSAGWPFLHRLIAEGVIEKRGHYYVTAGTPDTGGYVALARKIADPEVPHRVTSERKIERKNAHVLTQRVEELAHDFAWDIANGGTGEFTLAGFIKWLSTHEITR